MRAFPAYAIAALAGMLGAQSNVSPEDLYPKVRKRVLADLARMPDYTCVRTTTRNVYGPAVPTEKRACAEVISERRARKRLPALLWWDRQRLDVAIVNKAEVYSWVGAKQFEDNDLHRLIGYGHTFTGEFGPLLQSVLGHNDVMRAQGERNAGGHRLIEYSYDTPYEWSQYEVRVGREELITAYSGSVSLDAQTEDLAELTAVSAPLPDESGYCQVIDEVEYGRVRIGARDVLLPRGSSSWAVGADGVEMENVDSFSRCREYVGESTIRFDDDSSQLQAVATGNPSVAGSVPAIPAGLPFECRIVTPIDSRTSASGDPVEGVLRTPIRNASGRTLAPTGTRVNGRLVRLVGNSGVGNGKYQYQVGVRLQSIEINGTAMPFAANLAETSGNTSVPVRLNIPKTREQGGFVVFFFYDERLQLSRLDARWITVSPPSL